MRAMANTTSPAPPVAEKKRSIASYHGIALEDDYAWLRDPAYPEITDKAILAHLEAENGWFEQRMAPHQAMVETLFKEIRGRIKEADRSVPQKDGDWLYWTEFEEGAQYKKWWRKPVAGGEDQLILDENALAEGKDFFRLFAMSISQDGRLLAYSSDETGSERYTVRIKDLESGELLPDTIPGTLSSLVWVAGDTGIVYCPVNDKWRTDRAMLHMLGDDPAGDSELYRDDDEAFRVGVSLSGNENWLIVATGDYETSEVRLIPADDPTAEPLLVRAREPGVEYDADERDGLLYIHTNDTHENFRLATAPLDDPGNWTTRIAGTEDFYLTGVELFRDFYVVEGRLAGLDRIEVRYYDDPARVEPIAFPDASYAASLGGNPEWGAQTLRLTYESMVKPATTFDYNVGDRGLTSLKVQEIPSGYDESLYETQRLEIAARDGTLIPVSLVQRKDRAPGGLLHLYGYGAYSLAIEPGFSTSRISLLDRGFAYAIAHIRGGDDLGRGWYKAGKAERRWNTFNDFVDVAKGLIERGHTAKGRISIEGGSAGGELVGAALNVAPELFGAALADVPFVDVLSTMLDDTLPLTAGEWPEWGNPIIDKAAFELIRSYSPYDNVRAQAYPPMLVTAGLHDIRVTYWEPAKWVARLRELKTDDNELLLKTNMGAGHGGKSGRFDSLYELAEQYAFLLWQMGAADG